MTANDRPFRRFYSQRTPRDFDLGVETAGSGNRCDRPGLIVDADVGVLHRHADVAMAGQLTGFDKGCTVTQQLGDECFHVLIKLTQLLADHQLREFFEPING